MQQHVAGNWSRVEVSPEQMQRLGTVRVKRLKVERVPNAPIFEEV
jgi:hypothetical protein